MPLIIGDGVWGLVKASFCLIVYSIVTPVSSNNSVGAVSQLDDFSGQV